MSEEQKNKLAVKDYRDAIASTQEVFLKQSPQGKAVFQREAGFALMAVTKNPALAKCDPASFREAVVSVALTGISLNPVTKQAYLVPRKGKAVLEVSYMGMIDILRNAGAIQSLRGAVIREGDSYEFKQGTGAFLNHTPELNADPNRPLIAAYAVATFPDGHEEFHLMDTNQIRKRAQVSASKDKGPWGNWEDEMAIKTVLRSFYKYLPKSPAADAAFGQYDMANPYEGMAGNQQKTHIQEDFG